MNRLYQTLRRAAGQAAGWLEPGGGRCLVCAARLGDAGQTRGRLGERLCADCVAAVPWIDRPVCRLCGRTIYCPDCIRHPERSFVLNRSAVRYDETMREWLALYKYRGSEKLEQPLAAMLRDAFERLTVEVGGAVRLRPQRSSGWLAGMRKRRQAAAAQVWDAVTCVPVSPLRLEERGFNQAERLARSIAEDGGVPFVPLLVRTVHSEKQSMKGRADRFRTMRRVFGPDEAGVRQLRDAAASISDPLRVLLVDDIYTTGATSDACAAVIRQSLAERVQVYVLTWARS